jgi:hypothetical protein
MSHPEADRRAQPSVRDATSPLRASIDGKYRREELQPLDYPPCGANKAIVWAIVWTAISL